MVASEAAAARVDLWRAVEAQHVSATMALTDGVREQHVLERLLEESKPPVPAAAKRLHGLLFAPFRYPPPPGGSRFRGPNDPGVFYGAEVVRTACAELGYWRWRHLRDTPALASMPTKPQTVFRAQIAARCADLRAKPFDVDCSLWTRPDDYSACQRFARTARRAEVGAIRYESVRDPLRGGCAAVLAPAALARAAPLDQQTWLLSVTRERAVWQRIGVTRPQELEFDAGDWAQSRASAASSEACRR